MYGEPSSTYYCMLQTPNGTFMRVGTEWKMRDNAIADADYIASNLPKGFVVWVYERPPMKHARTTIYNVKGIL